jgi:hypothetical protein
MTRTSLRPIRSMCPHPATSIARDMVPFLLLPPHPLFRSLADSRHHLMFILRLLMKSKTILLLVPTTTSTLRWSISSWICLAHAVFHHLVFENEEEDVLLIFNITVHYRNKKSQRMSYEGDLRALLESCGAINTHNITKIHDDNKNDNNKTTMVAIETGNSACSETPFLSTLFPGSTTCSRRIGTLTVLS